MADPDAPAQSKRPRLGPGHHPDQHPVYNGHALPPPPPPHAQSTRPPIHPTLGQATSSPTSRYPPHTLPVPSQHYPPNGQSYPGPQPSPSLPPSDIRSFADPRTVPQPGHPPHGGAGTSPVTFPQDRISSYRQPPTPQSASAQDPPSSRSTSVSINADVKSQHPVPMEHGGHQPPWPMNPEHRSNGSIPNGYNHAISPSHSNGGHFQPPPPPSQQYQAVTPYAQAPYMSDYGTAAQQIRRKQVRATQACNHCRSRKQKCDEARPCQFCRENNFDCQYKDVPPPKQDRSMMQLQETVNGINDVLAGFVREFHGWKARVEDRLADQGREITSNHASPDAAFTAPIRDQSTSRWPTPIQSRGHVARVNSNFKMESPMVPQSNVMSPLGVQASTPIKQESSFIPQQQPATPADSVRTDHSRATESGPKEKSGLQGDHTTPAHKLLEEWQSMNLYYKDVPYLKRLLDHGREVSDYPMMLEQDRGLLRVWGVGEGQDLNDGAQGPGTPESNNESEGASPAPGKDGLWGHPPLEAASPSPDTPQDGNSAYFVHESGLTSDGRPDFRRHVLFELLESYMKSMHMFHPFMNEGKLKRMFREFSDQYSPRTTNARSPAAPSQHFNPGIKRKRSMSGVEWVGSGKGEIERSLRNAIVLLVLALGKVCAYKQPLPAPQSDRSPYINQSWGYVRDSPNPHGSFTSDTSEDHRQRNIDILPGMAYYAYATDILGNQQGGNTTAHAQAFLLAALYLGQYARVLESWSWISNACRIALILIKADYNKLLRVNPVQKLAYYSPKERYRLNLALCVYWTALQLESDILAEMSTLPPSGVSAHQSDIMYPEGVNDGWSLQHERNVGEVDVERSGEESGIMMQLYSTQIWFRIVLNEAHNALYQSNGTASFDTTNVKEVIAHARVHAQILENWRAMLIPELAWKDEELPSTDLNIARVRAKYYGGLYMMLRPYLRLASHVLEFPPPPPGTWGASQHNSPAPYGNHVSTPTSRNVQMVDLSEDQREVIDICSKCIDSAIRSTIAFDRVGEEPGSQYTYFTPTRKTRLIVTNVFGTLHAQFGNMLVLASVFKSKLYPLLPSDTWLTKANLAALFQRTIKVLDEVAPNSPILRMDLVILRNVQRQYGLE